MMVMPKDSFFKNLCLDEVGFRGSLCTVEECSSSDDTGYTDQSTSDRAVITIPYSNTSFQLRVLLSGDNPQLAPDFIFDDATFLSDCDAEELERHVPALRQWRGRCQLPALLRQLLTAYKAHVVSRLAPAGSLVHSYARLLDALGPDALEPMVAAGEPRPTLFLTLRLPLDLTTLRDPLAARRTACALLLLKATEKGSVQARLRLSPALAALAPDCRLPPPAGRPLLQYVQLVTTLTQRQLQEAADGRRARRLLLAALAAAAPDRLLDLSADGSRAVLRWDGAVAELLTAAYPRRPPTLCLVSVAGHWRREVPLPLPEPCRVQAVVAAVMEKVEELLRSADAGDDSEESLI